MVSGFVLKKRNISKTEKKGKSPKLILCITPSELMATVTIFVSHLNNNTTEVDLKAFFENVFNVDRCKIMLDHITGESREIAYVTVSCISIESIRIEMNNFDESVLDKCKIYLRIAHNKQNAKHLFDNEHFPGNRNKEYYQDFDHFYQEHQTHYGTSW